MKDRCFVPLWVGLIGLIISIYECIAASMRASALSGVSLPLAKDYFDHLRWESWIFLFMSLIFAFSVIVSVITRVVGKNNQKSKDRHDVGGATEK